MMTVVMAVMNWIVFIHVLTISSDVPMVGVFQLIGLVMVIMTVETPVMKTNPTAQKKVGILCFSLHSSILKILCVHLWPVVASEA